MGDFLAELRTKIAAVLNEHGESVSENSNDVLLEEDTRLFNSCQRCHENAHMNDDDWIHNFDQIRKKLHIDGSRLVNPPEKIMNMITARFREDSCPQVMFIVNDMFSTKFQCHIKKFFEELLDDRDAEDEFGEDKIFQGLKPDDVTFWSKTFMPVAIFYSYKHRYPMATDQEILTDCFKVGAGSKREDLIPEVNAFCQKCSAEQMGSKNIKIFLKQLKNNFNLPDYRDDSNSKCADISEADSLGSVVKKVFNPLLSESSVSDHQELYNQNQNLVKTVFNPLLSASSEGEFTENILNKTCEEELKPFKCLICPKSFRKEKFVQIHSSIFHKTKRKVVVPEFVKEPVEMMTSFSVENQLNTKDEVDLLGEKETKSNEQRNQKSSLSKKKKVDGNLRMRVQPKRGKDLNSERKTVKKALFTDM